MNFKIGEIHPNTPHLFADLAELLVLIGYDGKDRIHKNDLEAIRERSTTSTDEADEEAVAEQSVYSAAQNDRIETQLEDVWAQLAYRYRALTGYYPFTVRGEEIYTSCALTNKQRIYRFLLACSRLRSFSEKGVAQHWAKTFTWLCKHALRGLLPNYAAIKIFDANSQDRKDYYGSKLSDALIKLGNDLSVLKIHEDECMKQGASGDAGLDLVGVINFDDGAATSYALLGQCGAQETEWPKKTLEANAIRLSSFYSRQFDQPAMMFTPVCYRTASGEWVNNRDANGILLLDRSRILFLLDKTNAWATITSAEGLTEFESKFISAKAE